MNKQHIHLIITLMIIALKLIPIYGMTPSQLLQEIPPHGNNLLLNDKIQEKERDHKIVRSIMKDLLHNHKKTSPQKIFETSQRAQKQERLERAQLHLYHVYQDPLLHHTSISLTLKKIPLKELLRDIEALSAIQIILDADIEESIENLEMKDIPLGEALRIILSTTTPPLALVKQQNFFRITHAQKAIDLAGHQLLDDTLKSTSRIIIPIRHTKWDDLFKKKIEQLWAHIIGKDIVDKKYYLVCDDTTKKILAFGPKEQIAHLKAYIQELDINVPQVRIDIRVVMANSSWEDAFGIQWSGVYDQSATIKHFNFAGLGPFVKADAQGFNFFKDLATWSLNMIPSQAPNPGVLNLPIVFGGKNLDTNRLNILLNASENKRLIKTIMKPSLFVCSEEWAEILVGQELPQETRLDEAIEGKLTNVTTTRYKDIGMKIKVKPTINANHHVIFMDLYVENSSLAPQPQLKQSTTSKLYDYTIETARTKSHAILQPGKTTMIGGLITRVREKEQVGIPYLKDIPIIGFIFQGRQTKIVDKELMIFITPYLA